MKINKDKVEVLQAIPNEGGNIYNQQNQDFLRNTIGLKDIFPFVREYDDSIQFEYTKNGVNLLDNSIPIDKCYNINSISFAIKNLQKINDYLNNPNYPNKALISLLNNISFPSPKTCPQCYRVYKNRLFILWGFKNKDTDNISTNQLISELRQLQHSKGRNFCYAQWINIRTIKVLALIVMLLAILFSMTYFTSGLIPGNEDNNRTKKENRVKPRPSNLKVPNIGSNSKDDDGDGLSNKQEKTLGTNPNNPDTDGDGLSDGDEVFKYKTDPTKKDTDGDGLSDGDEVFKYKTDPTKKDTDGKENRVKPRPSNLKVPNIGSNSKDDDSGAEDNLSKTPSYNNIIQYNGISFLSSDDFQIIKTTLTHHNITFKAIRRGTWKFYKNKKVLKKYLKKSKISLPIKKIESNQQYKIIFHHGNKESQIIFTRRK